MITWRCLLWLVLLSTIVFLNKSSNEATAHPLLVECVCNSSLATEAVVSTSSVANRMAASSLVLPSCIEDVFAETGIRWYENGPFDGAVNYWQYEATPYSKGRAAKRLISLGYRCQSIQLYDPNEPIV